MTEAPHVTAATENGATVPDEFAPAPQEPAADEPDPVDPVLPAPEPATTPGGPVAAADAGSVTAVTAAAGAMTADSAGTAPAAADGFGEAREDAARSDSDLEVPVGEFDSDAAPDRQASVREITSVVTQVSQRSRGEHVVTLENGQVWQENFASRYFGVEPGDEVTIRKRRFGGYRLVAPSGKGYGVKRVR